MNNKILGPPNERSSRMFTPEEEGLLVSYFNFLTKAGVKLTVKKALTVTGYFGRKKGTVYYTRDGNPTPGWWKRFRMRHTEVNSLVCEDKTDDKTVATSSENATSSREATEKHALDEVELLVNETDGREDEERFYNMVTVTSRVSDRGDLLEFMVPSCVTELKDQIMTVTICSSANGKVFPSMVTVTPSLKKEINPDNDGNLWTETVSGDVNYSTFLEYLQKLDTLISNQRPVFVFTSGLQDLIGDEVVEFCIEKRIHMLHIPIANVIQPADIIPRIMQAKLEPTAMEQSQKEGLNSNVIQMTELLQSTCNEVQGEAMKTAFRETGIFPFDKGCLVSGSIRKREPNNTKESYAAKRALALQRR